MKVPPVGFNSAPSSEPKPSSQPLPPILKFDLETPLEFYLAISTIICFFLTLLLIVIGFIGGKHQPADPKVIPFIPVPFVFTIISFFIKKYLDCFFLVDTRTKEITYYRQFLHLKSIRPFLSEKDLFGVGVTGSRENYKTNSWYEYRLCLIDRNGKIINFGDPVSQSKLKDLNEKAAFLAQILQKPAFCCPTESKMMVKVSITGCQVSFENRPLIGKPDPAKDKVFTWLIFAFFMFTLILCIFSFYAVH